MVDIDGKTWRTIPAPRSFSFIELSQGCFYAVRRADAMHSGYRLSIWALEDYGGVHEEWILKHTATPFAPTEYYVARWCMQSIHKILRFFLLLLLWGREYEELLCRTIS
jgi:hypothetical protein